MLTRKEKSEISTILEKENIPLFPKISTPKLALFNYTRLKLIKAVEKNIGNIK